MIEISANTLVTLIMTACMKMGYSSVKCELAGIRVTNCAVTATGQIYEEKSKECVTKYINRRALLCTN